MTTILLLDDNDRSSLTCCRSLGAQGFTVQIARFGEASVAGYSRYATGLHELGDLTVSVAACLERLETLLRCVDIHLILPLSDAACQLCLVYREQIERHCPIALPDQSSFCFAHNKQLLLEKCQDLGIPAPQSQLLHDRERVLNPRFPLYLKPIHSALICGDRMQTFRVKQAKTPLVMENFLRFHLPTLPVMAQECCPGKGMGIYLLADKGKLLSVVQQERLHEPRYGGGSSWRRTVPLDPLLRDYTEALIESIDWTGPAMLEFKGVPETGEWRVMELNGRFWGSLALTCRAGLDFPHWWTQICLQKTPQISQPEVPYYQRHLGKDLRWWNQRGRPLSWIRSLRRDEGWDIEQWNDPLPAAAFWTQRIGRFLRKACKRIGQKADLLLYSLHEKREAEALREQIQSGQPRLLFICRGNICRSSFAEQYCRQQIGYEQVASAGSFPLEQRKPPCQASETARDFGIDLERHGSRAMDQKLIDWADAIVAMDERNLAEAKALVGSEKPILLLGSYDGKGAIPDPYHQSKEGYQKTYSRIANALERMFHS